jgi:hypothetical protein
MTNGRGAWGWDRGRRVLLWCIPSVDAVLQDAWPRHGTAGRCLLWSVVSRPGREGGRGADGRRLPLLRGVRGRNWRRSRRRGGVTARPQTRLLRRLTSGLPALPSRAPLRRRAHHRLTRGSGSCPRLCVATRPPRPKTAQPLLAQMRPKRIQGNRVPSSRPGLSVSLLLTRRWLWTRHVPTRTRVAGRAHGKATRLARQSTTPHDSIVSSESIPK